MRGYLFSLTVLAVLAAVGYVLSDTAVAAPGRCCTGERQDQCSGCKSFGLFFMALGTNTTYFCEDYTSRGQE